MKRPSFQFYPSDWMTEIGLRFCSLAARGLWIELMCIMHEAKPYGHLKLKNGFKLTPHVIARIVCSTEEEVVELLKELASFGVYSITPDGTIYSRRMVEDEKKRERWRAWWADGTLLKRLQRLIGGNFDEKQLQKMIDSQSGKCLYCQKKLPKRPHIDHKIPISRGGGNQIKNIALTCRKCNLEKGDKTDKEFFAIKNEYQKKIKHRSKKKQTRSSSSSSSSSLKNKERPPNGGRGKAPPTNPYPFTIFWNHKTQRIKVSEKDKVINYFTSFAEGNGKQNLKIREVLSRAQPGFERHAIEHSYNGVSPSRLTILFAKWVERDILTIRGSPYESGDAFTEAIRIAKEKEIGTVSD